MLKLAKNIKRHYPAVQALVVADIKTNVAATKLGWLWWLLDPILQMAVYYFVICVVFQRGGPGYHIFLLTGIVYFQLFSRTVTGCTNALKANAGLVLQSGISLEIFTLAPALVSSFFALCGLLIVASASPGVLGLHLFGVLPLVILTATFALSMGLFFSVFNVLLRDTNKIVTYLMRFIFFFSPILYSPDRIIGSESIPEILKTIYNINPLAYIAPAARDIVLKGSLANFHSILIWFAAAFASLQLGLWFFRSFAKQLPKRL
jgi:lipopolysaccharide transport system permease protein